MLLTIKLCPICDARWDDKAKLSLPPPSWLEKITILKVADYKDKLGHDAMVVKVEIGGTPA